MPAGEPRIGRTCGKGQAQRSSGATRFDTRAPAPEYLPETQRMPMVAERPSPHPRSTAHQQTTPRPADSYVQSAERAPDELAICRSGGCRVVRAGRGTEFARDRSASSPTREVLRKPARLTLSPAGIHRRRRPRTRRLQLIRSSRPARSTWHHPMLDAFYWLGIPDWYYAILISWPMAESFT